jgi:MerR family redox-sensitive transcriptional activator SoxR
MTTVERRITIGALSERSGIATSAIRFYEERGLITSVRTSGNQRRFPRETLRRLAVIKVAQSLGLNLEAIESALSALPNERTPSQADWEDLSSEWRDDLNVRILSLVALRDRLTGCIGCGCLSLEKCSLFNPGDDLAASGPGPHRLSPD